jgi:PAS domain S-box-containing protein
LRLTDTHRNVAAMTGALLLAAMTVISSIWTFRQIDQAARSRRQNLETLNRASALQSALNDAEAGGRFYSLTGDEAYLEPYLAVRDGARQRLEGLRGQDSSRTALAHLDALVPLMNAKLAELVLIIEARRRVAGALAPAFRASPQGRQVTEAIRAELRGFIQIEQRALARHQGAFQASMRTLLGVIAAGSLLTLVLAFAFVRSAYRRSRQEVTSQVHRVERRSLEILEASNARLEQANAGLRESEERLDVTLRSIGDAVIATDAEARVTRLNPVAEQLTGFTQAEAVGRPVSEIFRILDKDTCEPAVDPVLETLRLGTVHGLPDKPLLVARDGGTTVINDSCAPIRDRRDRVIGAVLVFRCIDREYAAQLALRDSATLIQTVLGTVVDGIITFQADDGIIETVNPAAERMFGYPAAELIGTSVHDRIPALRHPLLGSPGTVGVSDAAPARGLGREVQGQRRDGTCFPLEIAVGEMSLRRRRFFTGILRDLTARQAAEAEAHRAGALQRAIFESATFSSIATDDKGVIQIFNVGAERMLGYSAAEVVNRLTPAELSDPREVIERDRTLGEELSTSIQPGFEALVYKASRGVEDIYELTYLRKDGSRLPALVSVTALRSADGQIIGYLLVGTDNTARKQIEAAQAMLSQRLREQNAELESARRVADKANLAKSEFLSSMSHELRSPLNAILGFAQLMDSAIPPATPEQKASILQILRAGYYLLELINQILDLAVIESGKLAVSVEPVSLSEVLDECQDLMAAQGRQRGLTLTYPGSDLRQSVSADRTRLKQVLINLLSNAIKYNRPGGTVSVTCSAEARGRVRIRVRDTGLGLPPELQAQLFQPFNRLGQERGAEEGTGIGLVVSKLLIELMGGTIGVESTVGAGTCFWFELLAAAAPSDLVDAVAPSHLTPLPSGRRPRTLLYVEDNPANLELVTQLVARRPDLRLLSAIDGETGVALARRSLPDVILMDINLPGLSGLQALALLHADPTTTHIPVLALSASAMPEDIRKGLEAGFLRYLTKPIALGPFMEAVDTAMKLAMTSNDPRAGDALTS